MALAGIADVERDSLGTPAALTVSHPRGFDGDPPQPGERFLLHPRFTDFTTDGVVEFLRSGGADRHGLLLRLLRDPAAAAEPLTLDPAVEPLAADEIAAFGLTASQAEAFRQICRRQVVPVWGPPGTGKTHFLAAAILALAAAHARAGRPFRVLVTAFTHAAIENLLRKIAPLRGTCQPAVRSCIGKAKSWQGEDAAGIETVEESRLGAWLQDHPQAVVGATVYSCLKQYRQMPSFDLVGDRRSVPGAGARSGDPDRTGRRPGAAGAGRRSSSVAADRGRRVSGDAARRAAVAPVDLRGDRAAIPGCPVVARGRRPRAGVDESRRDAGRRSAPAGHWWLCAPADRELPDERRADQLCGRAAVRPRLPQLRPDGGRAAVGLDAAALSRSVCGSLPGPRVSAGIRGAGRRLGRAENPPEAQLAAQLVAGLRSTLRQADGTLFADDAAFFRDGVFVISPHRAQIRAIHRELRRQRRWQSPPLVDTVDKMQGREADAVVVSYGVSDPEFAAEEAEFIYGLNRLNVAVTRARAKCVVCLPRPLLDAPPQVLDLPEAARGLAFMRALVQAVSRGSTPLTFDLDDGVRATVYRARDGYQPPDEAVPAVREPDPRAEEAGEPASPEEALLAAPRSRGRNPADGGPAARNRCRPPSPPDQPPAILPDLRGGRAGPAFLPRRTRRCRRCRLTPSAWNGSRARCRRPSEFVAAEDVHRYADPEGPHAAQREAASRHRMRSELGRAARPLERARNGKRLATGTSRC